MTAALAIFVKTPGLSPVKTRLAADIGVAAAEHFHRLAAAAVAAVARAAMPMVSPCWAVAEHAALEHPQWQGLATEWQGEGDLGQRMHHVCSRRQASDGRVLLIGADAPQVTVPLLAAAVAALSEPATPFVLGRASDGGFWLFGTRQPVPEAVWLAPRYSSADAADDLQRGLTPLGGIAALPTLRDVDHGADLSALAAALDALDDPLPSQRTLRDWLHRPQPFRSFQPHGTHR
jgi:rSAM/selenodomain-associated transferase 1